MHRFVSQVVMHAVRVRHRIARLFLFAVLVSLGATPAQAVLNNGDNAVDVLGQFSSWPDNTTISYTQSSEVSPLGFGGLTDIAIDTVDKRLFVSDPARHRVLVFTLNSDNTIGSKIPAYVIGQTNFLSGSASTTQSTFDTPRGLAYDSTNKRLFVADYNNHRILGFDLSGGITNGMNATWRFGQSDFTSKAYLAGQSRCPYVRALAYDSSNQRLLMADAYNNRLTVFDVTSITDGENAIDLIGQYTTGTSTATVLWTADGGYNSPSERTVDEATAIEIDQTNHRLFVADTWRNRVLVYNLNTDNSLTDRIPDYVLGQNNFRENDSNSTQSGLHYPYGLAYDSANQRLFVVNAEDSRVMVYDLAGGISNNMNASYILGESPGNCDTTQSTLCYPYGGLAYDQTNQRLFVADNSNSRVMVYDFSGGISDNMNASFVLGPPDFISYTSDTTQSSLSDPEGLVYDSGNRRLFVADSGENRVMVYDFSGGISNGMNASFVLGQPDFTSSTAADTQAGLRRPQGLAYDVTNRRLFVSEGSGAHRVKVFDVASITNGENAVNVLGQGRIPTVPGYTVVDYNGSVLLLRQNGTNLMSVQINGVITSVKLSGSQITYSQFADRQILAAEVWTSNRIAWKIVSTGEFRYWNMDSNWNQTSSMPASGGYAPGGVDGLDMQAAFSIDASGNPLPASGNPLPTASAWTGAGSGLTQSNLNEPYGLAYDPGIHRLYVGDGGNSRIMIFDGTTMSSSMQGFFLPGYE